MILDVGLGWPRKFPPQTFRSNVIKVGGGNGEGDSGGGVELYG